MGIGNLLLRIQESSRGLATTPRFFQLYNYSTTLAIMNALLRKCGKWRLINVTINHRGVPQPWAVEILHFSLVQPEGSCDQAMAPNPIKTNMYKADAVCG